VGRTGVFVTLSIVLERMRYEGVVDMFQTVKMLFTQRPAMVQTEVETPDEIIFNERKSHEIFEIFEARFLKFSVISQLLLKSGILLLLLLQPFYGPLECVRDYLGEPVSER